MNSRSIRNKVSVLWIVVMFNMAFADILSLTLLNAPEINIEGPVSINITEELLLVSAVLIEIPVVMIFLSFFFRTKGIRWVNMVAAMTTIIFVIGGGALYMHYLFFASIEIGCLVLIIWYSWKWPGVEFE